MLTRNPSLEVFGELEYSMALKVIQYRVLMKVCRNAFLNLLKKRNVTAVPLNILIPGYGQLNATLVT